MSNSEAFQKQGTALKNAGPDPHRSLTFSQFDIALDKTTANLRDSNTGTNSSLLSNPSIELDANGKPLTKIVELFDPPTGKMFGSTNPLKISVVDPGSPSAMASVGYTGNDNVQQDGLQVISSITLYNALSTLNEKIRTPTWFAHLATAAAGPTSFLAAVAGKKHRILGGVIICAGAAAAAGAETLTILDAAADTGLDFTFYMPTAANLALGVGANFGTVVTLPTLLNGYLCAAVNTAINVTLSTAMTVGNMNITLWGTDE